MKSQIEGWMREKELDWLFEKSKMMESIVEIGSYKGKSTQALLEGCRGIVYSIDKFDDEEVYKTFMQNVGHYPNLSVHKMTSLRASGILNSIYDMIFIDGDHSWGAVRDDIDRWLPKCKKLICGHDYGHQNPGVKKAVHEVFKDIDLYETIWYKEL